MIESNPNDALSKAEVRTPAREPTVRGQLLLAAVFPLGFFLLLAILMVTTAFRQLTYSLALQRSSAIVQVAAIRWSDALRSGASTPSFLDLLPGDLGVHSSVYQIDPNGRLLSTVGASAQALPLDPVLVGDFLRARKVDSRMAQDPANGDDLVASYAPLPGGTGGLILIVPWSGVMAPARYFQGILIALLILGMLFSLYTLSLSIGRVTRPIGELVDNAHRAIPGSIFRPVPEQGPAELRTLIRAFNQMVVRLAEQQTSLRQYAHKALLSQEEERQRLSHELHDGTMQDLVGLVQRIELCRSEMDRDPALARRRLDELQELLEGVIGDVRRISNALRPSILEDLGLPAALQALCSDLERQVPSVHCVFTVSGVVRRLPPDIELAVFRVVQEALGNVRKHARQASHVEVEIAFRDGAIEAQVCNDGPVFPNPDVRSLVRGGHLGLAGMYERARLFHGELTLSSDPEAGTIVHLRLPYQSAPEQAEGVTAVP